MLPSPKFLLSEESPRDGDITPLNQPPIRSGRCIQTTNGYVHRYLMIREQELTLRTGWNSWNMFKAKINQSLIEETATVLVRL